MSKAKAPSEYLTIPEAAAKCGLTTQALHTIDRGFYQNLAKIGRHRGVPVNDLDGFKRAAKEAGYLK